MAKNHNIIIKVFLERPDEELNIKKISEYSKIDYKNTYNIIKELEKEGLITIKTFGKTKKLILKKIVHPLIFEAEFERKKDLLKNKDLNVLYERINDNIKNPFFIFLVFGSYAKGKPTKYSDIDLCLITDDKKTKEKIEGILNTFPLKTHFLSFTTEEFIKMLKTTDFNVGKEIVKNKVILKNIEGFYELIKNVN